MPIRRAWVILNAAMVTFFSLIAAAITDNPNWPMNIPLGIAVGASWGLLSWNIWSGLMARAQARRGDAE